MMDVFVCCVRFKECLPASSDHLRIPIDLHFFTRTGGRIVNVTPDGRWSLMTSHVELTVD